MDLGLSDLSSAREMRLHASAQALLYDIQRRVRSGYVWWTCGEVPVSRVLAVTAKLDQQYDVLASRFARSRRKAAGDPSAVLFLWPARHDPEGYTTCFRFLLLATAHLDGEVMYDGRHKPVRVGLYMGQGGVYHLQPTRTSPTGKESQMSYVWQLSPKCNERMVQGLREAAGKEFKEFQRALGGYRQLPMTSGYRLQLKAALQEALSIWRRNNRPSVVGHKEDIKKGRVGDPFRDPLPFVAGFPKLYEDPPMTLRAYLKGNDKRRKEIDRERQARLASEHPEVQNEDDAHDR